MRGEANSRSPSRTRRSSGNEVVTTFVLRNPVTTGAIAGLKVEENWYDKGGNPVGGDIYRHPRPLKSGEVISITLKTPRNPAMNSNQYQFSHANGTVKTDDRAEAGRAEDRPAEVAPASARVRPAASMARAVSCTAAVSEAAASRSTSRAVPGTRHVSPRTAVSSSQAHSTRPGQPGEVGHGQQDAEGRSRHAGRRPARRRRSAPISTDSPPNRTSDWAAWKRTAGWCRSTVRNRPPVTHPAL